MENYRNQEEALDRLFQDYAPGNKDIRDILLKAAALNAFYSTNIFSLYPVAEHTWRWTSTSGFEPGTLVSWRT